MPTPDDERVDLLLPQANKTSRRSVAAREHDLCLRHLKVPADGARHAQELPPSRTRLLCVDVVHPTVVMEVVRPRALRHLELPRVASDRAHADGAGLPLVRGIAKSIQTIRSMWKRGAKSWYLAAEA